MLAGGLGVGGAGGGGGGWGPVLGGFVRVLQIEGGGSVCLSLNPILAATWTRKKTGRLGPLRSLQEGEGLGCLHPKNPKLPNPKSAKQHPKLRKPQSIQKTP